MTTERRGNYLYVPAPRSRQGEPLVEPKTVLCVPTRVRDSMPFRPAESVRGGMICDDVSVVFAGIADQGHFGSRHPFLGKAGLEDDPNRQQMMVHAVVKSGNLVLVQKNASPADTAAVQGDPRLYGHISLGYGGHVTKDNKGWRAQARGKIGNKLSIGPTGIRALTLDGAFYVNPKDDTQRRKAVPASAVHTGIFGVAELAAGQELHLPTTQVSDAWWVPIDALPDELARLKAEGHSIEPWAKIVAEEFVPKYADTELLKPTVREIVNGRKVYEITDAMAEELLERAEAALTERYPCDTQGGIATACLTANGTIYAGASYKTAGHALSMHAEAVTLARATNPDDHEVVAITGPNCGSCRQLIWERAIEQDTNGLGTEITIITRDPDTGKIKRTPISELYTDPWPDPKGKTRISDTFIPREIITVNTPPLTPTPGKPRITPKFYTESRASGLIEAKNIPTVSLETLFAEGVELDFPFLDLVRESLDYHLAPRDGEVSREQIRSALAIIGKPDNLTRIIKTILDTPEELEKMHVLDHSLGFGRFNLLSGKKFKLKLHTYGWPKPSEETVDPNWHDHRFSKAGSLAVLGTLPQELRISSSTSNEYATLHYEYTQPSTSDQVFPVDEARLSPLDPANPTHFFPKGSIYTLDGNTIHRIPDVDGVATLFLHSVGPENTTKEARIFSNNPALREDDFYPLISSSKAAEILEQFLKKLI